MKKSTILKKCSMCGINEKEVYFSNGFVCADCKKSDKYINKQKQICAKRNKTTMEKYGVPNNFLNIDKDGVLKRSKTSLKKYGHCHQCMIKNHSQESKLKIRRASLGRERTQKSIEKGRLARIGGTTKLKGKTYEEILGKEKAIQLRQQRSSTMSKSILNGKLGNKYKDGYFFSKLNNKTYYYRSSYELAAYKLLDDVDAHTIIKRWVPEFIRIPYLHKNIIKYYIPDILVEYISGKKQMIEIKPLSLLATEKNILKTAIAKQYCNKNNIVYSIWTEKELNIK